MSFQLARTSRVVERNKRAECRAVSRTSRSAAIGPRWASTSNGASDANTRPAFVATWTATRSRPLSAPRKASARGTCVSLPVRSYVHAWYGHTNALRHAGDGDGDDGDAS